MNNKDKKPRDVSYSQGYKLIEKHGYETVKNIGIEHGMYETARRLKCSPGVIRHMAHKHSWKRPASAVPHLVKAVKAGRADKESYRNLDGSSVETKTQTNKEDK